MRGRFSTEKLPSPLVKPANQLGFITSGKNTSGLSWGAILLKDELNSFERPLFKDALIPINLCIPSIFYVLFV